jgi:hypothetical protein
MVTGMALSALLLGERPGRYQLGGCASSPSASVALAYDGLAGGGRLTWLGDLLFALAGCSWGVFTFLLRRWRVAPLRAVAAVTVPSALAIVPAWLVVTGGALPPVPAGTILAQWFFQGVMGGVLGVAAFGGAVRALGAAKASALPVVHARGHHAGEHPGAGSAADPARASRDGAGHAGPVARDPRPGAAPGGAPAAGDGDGRPRRGPGRPERDLGGLATRHATLQHILLGVPKETAARRRSLSR